MGNAGSNGTSRRIHEIGAAVIGVLLAAGVVYLAVAGRPCPGELTNALGVVLGYFFGVGVGRAEKSA